MLKKDVIRHFGSVSKAAEALDITRQAVDQWDETVPEGTAYKLQVLTGGKLKVRQELYQREQRL